VLTTRPRQRVFPGRADQIARARDFTRRAIEPCPVLDEAVLLVSELATNALEHTATRNGGQFQVTVCCGDTSLTIGVSDNGSGQTPHAELPDPESENGRGLGLVELIADRWGHSGGRHGRTVWFELRWKQP
jgi:serine/threonine-protein kinase RsbW